MPIKFLVLGGYFGFFFWGGGWKCRFYFYGRGDVSEKVNLHALFSCLQISVAFREILRFGRGPSPQVSTLSLTLGGRLDYIRNSKTIKSVSVSVMF